MSTNPHEESQDHFSHISPDGEDFMQDPTSFKDPFKKMRRRKAMKILGLVILFFAVLGLVFFVALKYFTESEDTSTTDPIQPAQTAPANPTQEDANSTEPPTETEPLEPGEGTSPLEELYPDAPEVKAGEVTIALEDSKLVTSEGEEFWIEGAKLELPRFRCEVHMNPTDFCYAARGEVEGIGVDIYYLKDAVHSKLFYEPEYWTELTVENSDGAGLLPVELGDDNQFPTVVVLNENSSGWMAIFQDQDRKKVQELEGAIKSN